MNNDEPSRAELKAMEAVAGQLPDELELELRGRLTDLEQTVTTLAILVGVTGVVMLLLAGVRCYEIRKAAT